MYISKSDFGWSRRTGWLHGNEEGYNNLVKLWQNRPKGRERTRPIHPSWEEVLKLFDPNDKERSQGAFCRWAGINRATFSSKQVKLLHDDIETLIKQWHYIGDGEGLDGSMNTGLMERGRLIYSQYRESGYAVPGIKKKKEVTNG